MTSSRGSDLMPDPVIHVTALISVVVLAAVLVWMIPKGDPAADGVAQASQIAEASQTAEASRAAEASRPLPSDAPTPPMLEATRRPADPSTEPPTEPPNDPPTAPPTAAPTEPPTQPPTEPPSERPTETPTEPPTDPPTAAPTERPRQLIAFAPLGPMSFGDDPVVVGVRATSGLPVAVTASGSCEMVGDRIRPTGAGPCTLTARQPGDADWRPATPVTRDLVIARAVQSISLEPLADTVYGADPVAVSVAATSGLDVALRAEGPCAIAQGRQLVITGAGDCSVIASQSGNEDWAPAADVRRTTRIARAAQDISFQPPGPVDLGAPPIELDASARSGLPIVFSADGPCVVGEDHVRPIGAGTCTLTATQEGNEDWAPATPVSRELIIARAAQTIAFEQLGTAVFGAEPVELAASATSGLPVAIRAEGPCSVVDGRVRLRGAGTCTLTASQAGNEDWAPADAVSQALVIMPAGQAIEFDPPAGTVFGAEPLMLAADAGSGLPVRFDAEGACTVVDGRLQATGAGTCTLTARQAGNDDWAPADDVVRELVIERASQAIMFEPLGPTVFGADPVELTATSSSGLPVSFRTEGPCVVAGGSVRALGAGTCRLTASQPGDADRAPAKPLTRELVIKRAEQSIAFEPLEPTHLGAEPRDLATSAESGLPVTVSSSGPCAVVGRQVHATGAGTCTLTATQPGDDEWGPAPAVERELVIERASQSVSIGPLHDAVFGSGPLPLTASASSGLPVTVTSEGACEIDDDGELVLSGAGACTLTATQPGDDRWAPAEPLVQELIIERAPQTVDLAPLGELVAGAGPQELSAVASSGLPVSFSAEGPCRIVDGGVLPSGAGICVVTARQPGDADFSPAAAVQQVFRIERAAQTISFPEIEAQQLGEPAIELVAIASSGLPVTYRAEGPCSIDAAGDLALTAPGVCTVTALQDGDADRAPAADVSRTFAIIGPSGQPSVQPTLVPEPSMAERDWPLPCTTWQRLATSEPSFEGAVEAVACLDAVPGISRYVLYRFPDSRVLGTRFTEQVTAARPALGVTDDACRPRSPGARTWEHGWLACWVPEGGAFAQLHWTDERSNTYGVLEATHKGLQRVYRHWADAYQADDAEAAMDEAGLESPSGSDPGPRDASLSGGQIGTDDLGDDAAHVEVALLAFDRPIAPGEARR